MEFPGRSRRQNSSMRGEISRPKTVMDDTPPVARDNHISVNRRLFSSGGTTASSGRPRDTPRGLSISTGTGRTAEGSVTTNNFYGKSSSRYSSYVA